MARKKTNVISFQETFREKYIKKRALKYCMPIEFVSQLVLEQEIHGWQITDRSGRAFIEDYLSINAIRYHQ